MTTDPQRIKRLEVASAFCLFDKKLRSSGNGSIVWGVLNLAIGGALLTANDRWGTVSVVLGLALVAAGIYERTVRDPKVIIFGTDSRTSSELRFDRPYAMGKVVPALEGELFLGDRASLGRRGHLETYSVYKALAKNRIQ
jgi:hypothetical protein